MLRIIYRICARENHKLRPAWYSKALCLRSCIVAQRQVNESMLMIVSDGLVSPEISDEINGKTRISFLREHGQSESFLVALSIAFTWEDADIVYFVEDDYLHLPTALSQLCEVFEQLAPDYVTLYDHPDRYKVGHDVTLHDNRIQASRTHIWRGVESTCMTFAAKVGCLREDLGIFLRRVTPSQLPQDRMLFWHLQRLGRFEALEGPRRLLLGAIPSLATHCEGEYLAPGVDWAAAALALDACVAPTRL